MNDTVKQVASHNWIPATWSKDIPVIAGTTVTQAVTASHGFNLAKHVNDTPSRVDYNRQQLATQTKLTIPWLWLNQIHSSIVVDESSFNTKIVSADASVARSKVAVVLTADCIPILLTNGNGSEYAAIHAGWQGLYKRIIAGSLAKMHTSNSALYAWIGPCIRQNNYEIDQPFFERFTALNPNYCVYFRPNRAHHYLADLPAIAVDQLMAAGIPRQHIIDSYLCSFSDKRFFSFRRDKQNSGRTATFIAKNEFVT